VKRVEDADERRQNGTDRVNLVRYERTGTESQRKVPRYIGSYVRGSDSEKKLREGPYKDEL